MLLQCVTVLLAACVTESRYQAPRSTLIPGQACSFQPYNKLLTCTCGGRAGSSSSLALALSLFIRDQGQEVREVLVEACSDLYIDLDLRGVNPTNIPFRFKNCGDLRIESVQFDPRFRGAQRLVLEIQHVTRVVLADLRVEEALQLTAVKVKEVLIERAHFAHIPLPGIQLQRTDQLTVLDSVFARIEPHAITVDTTIRSLKVVNNEFNINAVKVVQTTAGDHLYISCNRLLGQTASPECVRAASPPTPPPTAPAHPAPRTAAPPPATPPARPERWRGGLSLELLVGVAAGVGVVLLLLLLTIVLVCCRRRRRDRKEKEGAGEGGEAGEAGEGGEGGEPGGERPQTCDTDSGNNTESSECDERKSLLTPEAVEEPGLVEAQKPRFHSPVWLEDIHSNKLFNKQKSILSEPPELPPPPEETPRRPAGSVPFPVRSISEIIDSEDSEEELPPPPEEEGEGEGVGHRLARATETDL